MLYCTILYYQASYSAQQGLFPNAGQANARWGAVISVFFPWLKLANPAVLDHSHPISEFEIQLLGQIYWDDGKENGNYYFF